jgi:hypothetical protein
MNHLTGSSVLKVSANQPGFQLGDWKLVALLDKAPTKRRKAPVTDRRRAEAEVDLALMQGFSELEFDRVAWSWLGLTCAMAGTAANVRHSAKSDSGAMGTSW